MNAFQFIHKEIKYWGFAALIVSISLSITSQWKPMTVPRITHTIQGENIDSQEVMLNRQNKHTVKRKYKLIEQNHSSSISLKALTK